MSSKLEKGEPGSITPGSAHVHIHAESPNALGDYARVSIAFEVRERFLVHTPDAGLDGVRLVVEPVAPPYVKDYDAAVGHRPTSWAQHFDLSTWGIFAASVAGERVGGAVVAWGISAAALLAGRTDLAVLWDLRVAPGHRGQRIGAALFRAAEQWAVDRGARWLKVETQNINVPACRFYARQACCLGAIDRFAYPELPDEVQLIWYKRLLKG